MRDRDDDDDPFMKPVQLGPEHGFNYPELARQNKDPRNLKFLTRNERRFIKSLQRKGDKSMLVNLLTPIEATDADGTIIRNAKQEIPTLKEMILYALRVPHQSDQATNFKVKNERFLLIKRIDKVDEIELTEQECKSILERIGMIYLQVEMVGKCGEILSPVKKELKAVPNAEVKSPELPN